MKKILITIVLLMALTISAAADGVTITSFDNTVVVNADNSYNVTQTMVANFETPGTGLTRTVSLLAPSGRKASIKHVRCNLRCRKKKNGDSLTMRLGGKDITAYTEAYNLSYVYDIGYDFDESKDTLRINLADAGIGADADAFTFTITMPAEFNPGALRFVSGYYGALPEEKVEYTVTGNVISGQIVGGLMAYESIDVEMDLENGYFTEAVYKNAVGDFLQTISPYLSTALSLIGLFFLLTRCKNPGFSASISGRLDSGLNPAEMLYIINGTVNVDQMTSLIPYWASRGKVIINSGTGLVELYRVEPLDDSAPEHEKQLFEAIFALGKTASLSRPDRNLMRAAYQARRQLTEDWKGEGRAIFRQRNRLHTLLATLLPLAGCVMACIGCGNSIYRARMSILLVILLFTLLGIGCWAVMLITGWIGKKQGARLNLWGPALGFLFMIVCAGNLYRSGSGLITLLGLACSMAVSYGVGMLLWDMTPRTRLGSQLLQKSLATRDFVRYSSDKQVRQAAGEDLAGYYYSLLPYAGAFGLESAWTDRFLSVRMAPPMWFPLDTSGSVTPLAFMTQLEQRMHYVKRALTGSDTGRALALVYVHSGLRRTGNRLFNKTLSALERLESFILRVQRFFRRDDDEF